jgi:hypothetical protein
MAHEEERSRLFHISEEPALRVFYPRPQLPEQGHTVTDDVVWAIDEAHLPNYLLPRACPRVTYRSAPTTSDDDRARFFTGSSAHVVAIGADWLERAMSCTLFVYELPSRTFELLDTSAGYWVSRHLVEPLDVTEMRAPLVEIVRRRVELRVLPLADLWSLRDAVAASTVDFSIIRMRHAARPDSLDHVNIAR